MGIWIYNYNTNEDIKRSVDLYQYNNRPTVYPTYTRADIAQSNPRVFTNFEKIINDSGNEIETPIDFSGVATASRGLGDGGGIYCQCDVNGVLNYSAGFSTCQSIGWPFCNAAYNYTIAGDQAICQTGILYQNSPCYDCRRLECLYRSTAPDGNYFQPIRTINHLRVTNENGEPWNDVNLWHNSGFIGNVLVENDGPPYGETGGYEYVLSVGHALTASPCSSIEGANFSFWDHVNNVYITRTFGCPCLVFPNMNPPQFAQNGPFAGVQCVGDDQALSNDQYRLWVMLPNQEPIPNYIKRYKNLSGFMRTRDWPTYGFHNNHRISKTLAYRDISNNEIKHKIDRNIPGSYGLGANTFDLNHPYQRYVQLRGQGDDGGSVFTVTDEGETIFMGWHNNNHGAIITTSQPIDGCNSPDDIFQLEGDYAEFNKFCLPNVYIPENYTTPPIVNSFSMTGGINSQDGRKHINDRLQELNLPQIKTYKFPEYANPIEEINISGISDTENLKYPLKESPHLSRESLNGFFLNSNYILFEEKRMLQASELNELQEKFYKKESLMIEHQRNWLKKEYLTETNFDIFGTLNYSALLKKEYTNFYSGIISKILPQNKNLVNIQTVTGLPSISVTLNPGWYLLNNNYTPCVVDENDGSSLRVIKPLSQYIDFIKIDEIISADLNLSDMQNDDFRFLCLNIDVGNIINCEQYEELKDNSGGSKENSPCGAKRNHLYVRNVNQIFLNKNTSTEFEGSRIFSQKVTTFFGVNTVLIYAKKKNNLITLHYSNDLMITSMGL